MKSPFAQGPYIEGLLSNSTQGGTGSSPVSYACFLTSYTDLFAPSPTAILDALQSINALAVAKNPHPISNGHVGSLFMSSTWKSAGKVIFPTLTITSLTTPTG